jgi:hypothetical protein
VLKPAISASSRWGIYSVSAASYANRRTAASHKLIVDSA